MAPKMSDADLRMDGLVRARGVGAVATTITPLLDQVNRKNLAGWVAQLKSAETDLRKFRKQLEALQARSTRTCPECGRAVVGRTDAIYCETRCRLAAHRSRHSAADKGATPSPEDGDPPE